MTTPNFTQGIGRLATDHLDFEAHLEGTNFRQNATTVDIVPITINSISVSTVQQAITAIASNLTPPVISSATTTSKGIIQLSGDIAGSATVVKVTGLQGNAVTTLAPTDGQVLTWDDTLSAWNPSNSTTAFTANGDLSGNNALQNVINLGGTIFNSSVGGVVKMSANVIDISGTVIGLITQDNAPVNSGSDLTVRAQSAIVTNKSGANLVLAGGAAASGTGIRGGVKLQLTTSVPSGYPTTAVAGAVSVNMVQIAEPVKNSRVLSLCNSSDITSSNINGDMVIFIGDTTSPVSIQPSGGTGLYSQNGQLWIKQGSDGNNFPIGSIPNPSIWGTTGQQTYSTRVYTTSSAASSATALTFPLPDETSSKVDVLMVGKLQGAADSVQYTLSMGYLRHSGGAPVALGSVVISDIRGTTAGLGWTNPTISVSSNNLQVITGAGGTSDIIKWFVIIQLTMCAST